MSDKKNIDRIFQEKFKDFEESPKKHVWKNIESELKAKKKRKPILIPLWYKIGGVAALLAIAFFVGNILVGTNTIQEKVVTKQQKQKTTKKESQDKQLQNLEENAVVSGENNQSFEAEEKQTKEAENKVAAKQNTTQVANNEENTTTTSNNSQNTQKAKKQKNTQIVSDENFEETTTNKQKQNNLKDKSRLASEENAAETKNQANQSFKSHNVSKNENLQITSKTNKTAKAKNKNLTPIALAEKDSLLQNNNAIAGKNAILTKEKSLVETAKELQEKEKNDTEEEIATAETKKPRWYIKPSIAPIYYGGLDGGNAIDAAFSQNSSEGEISSAYGINLAYAISEKWKIRSGIGKVNMGYNINNIVYGSAVNAKNIKGIDNQASNIQILSERPAVMVNDPELQNNRPPLKSGTLNQKIGYIEVPLEVEYSLINSRFAVNLIGGASTLFLENNEVAINSAEGTTKLGESSNLNSLSFSTNLGVGFGYELSKSFDLNLEPTFNYQINTFNNNANGFKPYYFGVYTGFSFKF